MTKYIIQRVLALIPVLFGISILVFSLMRLIPGDPVLVMLGDRARVEDVEKVREQLGLNRPLYIQYLEYMRRLLRGDMGRSMASHVEVSRELLQRLPATMEMVVFAMLIGVTVSWVTKPKPESELAGLVWNRESLRLPQGLRERSRGLRNPAFWYLVILSLTIAMYVVFW